MSALAFDLVVRNARVATTSDVFLADIGVQGSRIVQLGHGLPRGARDIDADDFDTGTRAAACGGAPTLLPRARRSLSP